MTELSPLLWQVARAAGLSAGDAEDVMQTVWLRLVAHLGGIHDAAALTGWLVTTTRREAWRVRAAGRRQLPPATRRWTSCPTPGQARRSRSSWPTSGASCGRPSAGASRRAARNCCGSSPSRPRPDYTAVAAALGMPVGSIGPTRGRCLAKLRALLADEPGGTR